jgi:uncharacterized protein YggE
MSLFQRAFLGTFVASVLLLALVIAAKGTASAAIAPAGPAIYNTIAGDTNGGIARGLVTTGAGNVTARPDMVEVSLGVSAIADTAAAAQRAIAEREARVLDRAATLGIPARDTKTASCRIDLQYSYQPGVAARLTDYQAPETIIVIVRDVEAIGTALDTFVQDDCAMNTTIRFTPRRPEGGAGAGARSRDRGRPREGRGDGQGCRHHAREDRRDRRRAPPVTGEC